MKVPWKSRTLERILIHPFKNEVFVVSRHGNRFLVEGFDLATHKSILAFESNAVPSGNRPPTLSADGSRLFVRQNDGAVKVFNVTMRR